MGVEYRCICKDCQVEFGYSEASIQAGTTRGLSRPERCPACRQIHSREGRAIGIPQIPLKPSGRRKPDSELQAGRLGKIFHPDRPHRKVMVEGSFGKPDSLIDFGITDDDIRTLFKIMQEHQVVVVVGPTGSGKSTFLPYRLMMPPDGIERDIFNRYGQIVITQPRTQATRSIASFVARDLHGSSLGAGFDVGFRHRDAPMSDWRNKLVYVTDGTLINWIVSGQLDKLSVIMIDEAHERSLNIDLILGLLKQQLPRYPLLKLIIASATINAELFQNYYGGPEKTPLVTFRGLKQYAVEAYFPAGDIHLNLSSRKIPADMAGKVRQILQMIARGTKEEGDILGFLPGAGEIEQCIELLREGITENPELRDRGIGVYPLYSTLPQEELDRALAKKTHIVRDRVMHCIESAHSESGEDRLLVLLLDRKSAGEAKNLVEQAMTARGVSGWTTILVAEETTGVDSFPRQIVFTTHAQAKRLTGIEGHTVITDRRVIISTNVAETSLTVDGIVYVVDSGLIKESRWDPVNGATELPTRFHSRAGCRQRWGRAGRVRDGEAHMIYTDVQFEDPAVFPAHTMPEIQRSCLETVVLTAKAAGISDIANFDWIERPPQAELSRAPGVLKASGALDADGDLSGFGLELQTFMTEIPIASLLVATDQFACGVEMATLAAILKVQFRNLLGFDRNWDFATRAAVKSVHEGLAASCRDDLEFYFKIYSIFAESPPERRKKLCRLFFINEDNFSGKFQEQRLQFLETLAIGKKADEDRTLSFSSLERFRFILAVSLPESFIFHNEDDTIRCRDTTVQLEVELENSVMSRDALPSCFLALSRRVRQTREGKRLAISCLIRVDEKWLAARGRSILEHALYAAELRGNRDEGQARETDRARIFADVFFPVGSLWTAGKRESDLTVAELISLPDPVRPVFSEERRGKEEDTASDDIGDIDPLAGTEKEENRLIARAVEEEDVPPPLEYDDEEEESGFVVLPEARLRLESFLFRQTEGGSDLGKAVVSGYEWDASAGKPVVLLAPHRENPATILEAGGHYSVQGEAVSNLGGKETALWVSLVSDPQHRFLVSAKDLSFSGSYSIPERLCGKTFNLVAVEREGVVRLTRLPLVEEKLQDYLRRNAVAPILGTLLEFDGPQKGRVLLKDLDVKDGIAEIVYANLFSSRDKADKVHYEIGQNYPFYLQSNYGYAHESLPFPTEDLLAWIEVNKHKQGVFYDHRRRRLHCTRPLSSSVRAELEELSSSRDFRMILSCLYRFSNRPSLRALQGKAPIESDKTVALEEYRHEEIPEYTPGETVRGRISEIWRDSVSVVLDRGGRGVVSKQHLAWDTFTLVDPRERISCGQEVEARVLEVKSESSISGRVDGHRKVRINLSQLREEEIPGDLLEKYKRGSVHNGWITRIDDDKKLVLAQLDSGIVGLIPSSHISHTSVERISDHLRVGQDVQVSVLDLKISHLDVRNPIKLMLSAKAFLRHQKIDTKFQVDTIHRVRITKIFDDKGFAFAELAPGVTGFIHKNEVSHAYVARISEKISIGAFIQARIIKRNEQENKISLTIRNAFNKEMQVAPDKVELIAGAQGRTIKEISVKSGCLIICDFNNTGRVTIKGPTADAIETAEKLIHERLEQRPAATKKTEFSITVIIPGDKIHLLIGVGGKTIDGLRKQSRCRITCDKGVISITGHITEHVHRALDLIRELIPEMTWDGVISEKAKE